MKQTETERKAKMNKRNDIHKPSSIIPEDYYFVALGYQKIESLGDVHIVLAERTALQAHMKKTGGTYSNHEHGGNCFICGAYNVYEAIFYHAKTNSYIRTGMDCAEKLEMGDAARFRAFKKSVHDAMERQAGKAKAEVILNAEGLQQAFEVFKMVNALETSINLPSEEATIYDIVSRLVKYGNLSEAQMNFLHKLVERINTRAAREEAKKVQQAKWAEEKEAAANVPTGRIEIKGTVLKVDEKENNFGVRLVMTIKTEQGFILWGSVPVAISNVEKGNQVEFTATVEPSSNDPKFGFFKRPSKAKINKASE